MTTSQFLTDGQSSCIWYNIEVSQLRPIAIASIELPLAPLNLDADSMAPAGWPSADRVNRFMNSWAFDRALIFYLSIKTAAAIEEVWRPLHDQVEGWEDKQNHQKEEPATSLPYHDQSRSWIQAIILTCRQGILHWLTRVSNPYISLDESRGAPLCQCWCSTANFVNFNSHKRKIGKNSQATLTWCLLDISFLQQAGIKTPGFLVSRRDPGGRGYLLCVSDCNAVPAYPFSVW